MSCISDPLALDVGGMKLKVPVVIASGTWAYEAGMWADDLTRHVGAICSKAITKDPCAGNPGCRVWETPSGLLNSIGLQNLCHIKHILKPFRFMIFIQQMFAYTFISIHTSALMPHHGIRL
mgnify:CR=1 FL=1